jgi:hypothetical protein
LVAFPLVRDLLFSAKDLFIAAMMAGAKMRRLAGKMHHGAETAHLRAVARVLDGESATASMLSTSSTVITTQRSMARTELRGRMVSKEFGAADGDRDGTLDKDEYLAETPRNWAQSSDAPER